MIEIKNLSFSYGSKKVLDGISLKIEGGDFLAILGSNGAGKSTLLKLMSGYLKPTEGEILFDGKNIKNISPSNLARLRAVLEQQTAAAFDYPLADFVCLSAKSDFPNLQNLAMESLKKVGLENFERRTYKKLSGGEMRRADMARVLCQFHSYGAKILLLDEAIAGLDPAHAQAIMKSGKEIAESNSCIVSVLHDPNLALSYANKCAIIKDGKLLRFGDTKELMTSSNLSNAYNTRCEIFEHPSLGKFVCFPQ